MIRTHFCAIALLVVGAGLAQTPVSVPRFADPAGIVPDRVTLHFREPVSLERFREMVRPYGECVRTIPSIGVHVLRLARGLDPIAVAAELSREPDVEWAEPDHWAVPAFVPNDPLFGTQWGKTQVGAESAWDVTWGDSDSVIAVIDSGVMLDHEDLVGQFVPGWNILAGNDNVYDDFWHGTRVTGIAAAIMNNGIGLAGMAPACRYMPVKVVSSSGAATTADLAAGMTWAVDNGARVVSVSLASLNSDGPMLLAARYCRTNGVVLVCAAGNFNNTNPTYPATYPESIAVAASYYDDVRGWQSSYGSRFEVAAPGQNVQSTGLAAPPGTYENSTGTSFSTPLVAAEAGMIYGIIADPGERTTALADEVRNIIQTNVVDVNWVQYGRVDVAAAVHNSFVNVSGNVALDTWAPGPDGVRLELRLRDPDAQTVVEARTITLDAQGDYSAQFTKAGVYDLVLSGGTWLDEGYARQDLTRGGHTYDFTTRNGDVNGDNAITLNDLSEVLLAFSLSGPQDANGDGVVNLVEINLILLHFGAVGF